MHLDRSAIITLSSMRTETPRATCTPTTASTAMHGQDVIATRQCCSRGWRGRLWKAIEGAQSRAAGELHATRRWRVAAGLRWNASKASSGSFGIATRVRL